jgi:hypothetical protein
VSLAVEVEVEVEAARRQELESSIFVDIREAPTLVLLLEASEPTPHFLLAFT